MGPIRAREAESGSGVVVSYIDFLAEAAQFLTPEIIDKIDSFANLHHYLGNFVPDESERESHFNLYERILKADPETVGFQDEGLELRQIRDEKYPQRANIEDVSNWISSHSLLPRDDPDMAEALKKLDELRDRLRSY